MKPFSPFARWWPKEVAAGTRLPYSHHLDERTIELRDGSLMQCLTLEGKACDTADAETLDHYLQHRDSHLRAAQDSRLVIYQYVVRRRVQADLEGHFNNGFARYIQQSWQQQLDQRELYTNELFIAVVYRPAEGRTGWLERLKRRSRGRQQTRNDELKTLNAATQSLLSGLASYRPRLLTTYRHEQVTYSEPLALIAQLFNGDPQAMPLPLDDGSAPDLGHCAPRKRLSFGLDTLEIRGGSRLHSALGALISFKDYPQETRAGLLDGVLQLPAEFTLTQSFAFVDRQVAQEKISLAMRRLRASDDDGVSLRQSLSAAKDASAAGQTSFGHHHVSLMVRAPDAEGLDQAIAQALSALADTGAIAVREDINMEPAFWGQFPGNLDYVARRAMISSANFAALASLHNNCPPWPEHFHWGAPTTCLEMSSGSVLPFSTHRGDLGHFTVIGPSGSGKTVLLNFLTAQSQKFSPRTVFFDKDRGAECFLRSIDGHYHRLQCGQPSGFNPLQLPDTATNRQFLQELIAQLVSARGNPLSTAEAARISEAVDTNFEQPRVYRRLRYFQELLAGSAEPHDSDLAARLAPWCGDGEHAWLFDAASDGIDMTHATLAFDMTDLLNQADVRTPAMMYLFHRLQESLDGRPTLIVIDEGWKVLDDPIFAARLKDWMKTLRKRNAVVGFGTQSPRDALDSSIASTITEQVATQIFMPNPRAQASDYCEGFSLSQQEWKLVQAIPPESRCFLIKQGHTSHIARLDLSGAPDLVQLFSGREAFTREFDQACQTYGAHPSCWWPVLFNRPWPGDLEPQTWC